MEILSALNLEKKKHLKYFHDLWYKHKADQKRKEKKA